jgi:hypothetical protein
MPTCPRCDQELGTSPGICPFCGVSVALYQGPRLGPQAVTRGAPLPRPARPRSSGRGTAVVVLLLVAAAIAWVVWPRTLPRTDLVPSKAHPSGLDPCLGKARCLVIYMAPWCPTCKGAARVAREAVAGYAGSREVGVQAVVGQDDRGALEEMAVGIGPNSFLDLDGALYRQAGGEGVPVFWVLDEKRHILKKQLGAMSSVPDQLRVLGLPPLPSPRGDAP